MILLKIVTNSGSSYLIDTVNQQFKRNGGDYIKYDHLEGEGKIGEVLHIHLPDNKTLTTTPIVELTHVRG